MRVSYHAVKIVVTLGIVRQINGVRSLLLPEDHRVVGLVRIPLGVQLLMSRQHGIPIKGRCAGLIGVPAAKVIPGTGGVGGLHGRSRLSLFHGHGAGVGRAAAGAAVVLVKADPEGVDDDGVQQDVAVGNRHRGDRLSGGRRILRLGPALEGLGVQLGNDGHIGDVHILGGLVVIEQNFLDLNGLAGLAVERNIIGSNQFGIHPDGGGLGGFDRGTDHDLRIPGKPAMEGLVGRKRRDARIGDGLVRTENLRIEQLTVRVEVIGDGDAFLSIIDDFVLVLLQGVHGEGGCLERDRAVVDRHALMDAF